MGRNQNNNKNQKGQLVSEEEEVSVEGDELKQQAEFEDEDFDQEADEQIDGDQVLLLKIEKKLQEVNDDEKLSWAAVYHIKKQQAQMNDEMQKQIDAINEKYQLQRMHLMHKISEVVAGKKLEKSVYAQNEFIKSINLNKTKPRHIADYWGKVFAGCGLIAHQHDVDILQKINSFRVDLIDVNVQNFKLTFDFKDNQFFENRIIIHIQGSIHEGTFQKKLQFKAKSQKVEENSLFGLLIGDNSDDQQFLDTCHDLYRAYISSTYFYFYEPVDDLDEGEDGDDEERDDEDGDDIEDDVEDLKVVQKPKGSSIPDQPECKNQ